MIGRPGAAAGRFCSERHCGSSRRAGEEKPATVKEQDKYAGQCRHEMRGFFLIKGVPYLIWECLRKW